MAKRRWCEFCEDWRRADTFNTKGMCWSCELEFQRVLARVKWNCDRSDGCCNTPVTCATAKKCIILRAQLELVFSSDQSTATGVK